jgi:hypothetical protein
MKYTYTFKNESLANRFKGALEERSASSIESETDEDGVITVSYAIEEARCDKEKYATVEDVDEKIHSVVWSMADALMKEVQWQMNWINSEIDYLYTRFYRHEDGHLPSIKSPAQMEGALKALGINEDYEVKKKVIYASGKIQVNNLK